MVLPRTNPTEQPSQSSQVKPDKPATDMSGPEVKIVNPLEEKLKRCEEDRTELRRENDILTQKNKNLQQQNTVLEKKLDETTHPGGSLVKAYCESATVSRNTAGATNDCGINGYTCEPVSGLCRTTCSSSSECDYGFVCDLNYSWRCLKVK